MKNKFRGLLSLALASMIGASLLGLPVPANASTGGSFTVTTGVWNPDSFKITASNSGDQIQFTRLAGATSSQLVTVTEGLLGTDFNATLSDTASTIGNLFFLNATGAYVIFTAAHNNAIGTITVSGSAKPGFPFTYVSISKPFDPNGYAAFSTSINTDNDTGIVNFVLPDSTADIATITPTSGTLTTTIVNLGTKDTTVAGNVITFGSAGDYVLCTASVSACTGTWVRASGNPTAAISNGNGSASVAGIGGAYSLPIFNNVYSQLTLSGAAPGIDNVTLTGSGYSDIHTSGVSHAITFSAPDGNLTVTNNGPTAINITATNSGSGPSPTYSGALTAPGSTSLAGAPPILSISSSTGHVGDAVLITGSGYVPNSSVSIRWDNSATIASLTASATGSLGPTAIIVPASPRGLHTISSSFGNATATLSISSAVTTNPASVNVGDQVIISGTGFAAGENIVISLDGASLITFPLAVSTDINGSFSASFIMPQDYGGNHVIKALDSGGQASATFNIGEGTNPAATTPLTISKLTVGSASVDWAPIPGASGYRIVVNLALQIYYYSAVDGSGVMVDYNEGNVNATITGLEPLTKYYVSIWATSPSSFVFAYVSEFTTPPVAPSNLMPQSGAAFVPINPTFTWDPVSGATGYEFDLSDTPDFINSVIVKTGLTIAVLPSPLGYGKGYYWRVRAEAGQNDSEWTGNYVFTTVSAASPNLVVVTATAPPAGPPPPAPTITVNLTPLITVVPPDTAGAAPPTLVLTQPVYVLPRTQTSPYMKTIAVASGFLAFIAILLVVYIPIYKSPVIKKISRMRTTKLRFEFSGNNVKLSTNNPAYENVVLSSPLRRQGGGMLKADVVLDLITGLTGLTSIARVALEYEPTFQSEHMKLIVFDQPSVEITPTSAEFDDGLNNKHR